MAFTATLTEPTLDAHRFAGRLAAIVTFFAAQPSPADDDPEPDPRIPDSRTADDRAEVVPGEPVDTSHHEESQSPVASTGVPGPRDRRKGRKRSGRKRE
ncbi:hypothetical protein SAMN05660874_03750 [Saccharopolyspora flava]|uniref:Uncharacterized protein n=1 Tax=Saccharopolyspora flava TaxID=95161 RepID=A0A1I6T838_9PSEU|nr:hypothetical protein SAMN05660874_03750 [Saccharopolyspora flava]